MPSTVNSSLSLKVLRDSIPDFYFRPSISKSLFYFFWDLTIILTLYISAYFIQSNYYLPFFWFATGTMFWALFVVGHDCGHGSFSKSRFLNSFIGHICHTPLLVPYHGWRISHRIHHSNTGNADKDETWHPLTQTQYNNLTLLQKIARYNLFLIVFPLYLFVRSSGRDGSHFHPSSPMFKDSDRKSILLSSFLWILMASLLVFTIYNYGFLFFITYYFIPYTIFVIWLSLVTFLHHTDISLPWYRGKDWNFLKGAMSTMDRKYGIFEPIHHNIGTHVIHHIFAGIPHYHLIGAKAHLKNILGDAYLETKTSVLRDFLRASKECIVIENEGSPLFYKKAEKD